MQQTLPESVVRLRLRDVAIGRRPRKTLDLDPLMASLKKRGQMTPVLVTDERRLVLGFRRIEAMRALGWDTCLCSVWAMNDLDQLLIQQEDDSKPLSVGERLTLMRWIEEARSR